MKKFLKFLLFAVYFLTCLNHIKADLFSSVERLSKLPEAQRRVVELVDEFIKNQDELPLDEVGRTLERFESIAAESNKNPKKFMEHPINAYLMIKSLALDLNSTLDLLNSTKEIQNLSEKLSNITLPTEEDYDGALAALNRLQHTYLLNSSQIRSGMIGRYSSFRSLNAFECFEMGRVAHEKVKHDVALEWYNEALKQLELEGIYPTIKKSYIQLYLASLHFELGDQIKAIGIIKSALETEPDNEVLSETLAMYKESLIDDFKQNIDKIIENDSISLKTLLNSSNIQNYKYMNGPIYDNYESLCRGDHPGLSAKRSSKLKCRYVNDHPYLKIGPVKEEQVFDDPPIWVYYEVATEDQIKKLIEFGTDHIDRAKVVRSEGNMITADYRISQTGWLRPEMHPLVNHMEYIVHAVTKLDTRYSDVFQINNYGIGGVYEPHHDFSPMDNLIESDRLFGRRMATWMYYFEAPEQGGATVFPLIGARVEPVRRSAVFWYNLYPSLNGDQRSLHAGCPVLVGSKWVSNLWIRSDGQMFQRPCDLVKEDANDY